MAEATLTSTGTGVRRGAAYGGALCLVAGATAVAHTAAGGIPDIQASLFFTLPVLLSALVWGYGPSLVAAAGSVAAFDFFLTPPFYAFSMDQAADTATFIVLIIVAGVTSAAASRVRSAARQAQRTAIRERALHELARAALRGEPEARLLALARHVLAETLGAGVVFLRLDGEALVDGLDDLAGSSLTSDDRAAVRWLGAHGGATRAAAYPFPKSTHDFWAAADTGLVVGVRPPRASERPADMEATVALVAGYVADAARHVKARAIAAEAAPSA